MDAGGHWERGASGRRRMNVRKLCTLSVLAAIAYLAVALIRIPIVPGLSFLTYEPKDVVIVMVGFMFGPLSAAMTSVVVSFIEMITISSTGGWGFMMNVLSTCSFACVASAIYQYRRSMGGAVIGLVMGCLTVTAMMLLWNYLVTPIYQGWPRATIAEMLFPYFMPFNLIKSGINTGLTLLLYKGVVGALRRARLMEPSPTAQGESHTYWGMILSALLLLIALVGVVLIWNGAI